MTQSIKPEEEDLVEIEDLVQELKDTFLSHPETKMEGEVERLQYTFWRAWVYAMDEEEVIEIRKYHNGPLEMTLKERIEEDTGGWVPGNEIVGLEIIDTEHGLSSPRQITDVDCLKEVLKVLDQERKQEGLQIIRDHFSETPGGDDSPLSANR